MFLLIFLENTFFWQRDQLLFLGTAAYYLFAILLKKQTQISVQIFKKITLTVIVFITFMY